MFDEPLALISLIATLGLLAVTWRAATAAKQSADIAAREFRLRSRPLVAVKWMPYPRKNDHVVPIFAEVTEVAGIATTLHSVEFTAASLLRLDAPPVVETKKPNATLSGDVASYGLGLELAVPQALVAPRPRILVATLVVKVVISAAGEEADQETWQAAGLLDFDTNDQRFVATSSPHMHRVAVQTRGRRSRFLDPVCRAWERWWESVQ